MPRSLTYRILLLQLVWTFFIYLLVITVLWFATSLIIESSVRHQGEDWIVKLDEMGMPIYATRKPGKLKEAIAYLRNFPEIACARYLDESGKKILAEYIRKGNGEDAFPGLTDAGIEKLRRQNEERKPVLYEKVAHSQMRVTAPIWVKSIPNDGLLDFKLGKVSGEKVETIGYIQVMLDYSKVTDDLNRNIFNASLLIAGMLMLSALLMRMMVHRALRPLQELEEPLARLARGETDVCVSTDGDQEIARIGAALNATIDALRLRDAALRRMADHDALTGLVNRAYFVGRLEQEVKRVARGGGSAALFFFDLDRFKNINDTYGHAAGDRLLIQVTRQLGLRVRENDLFARYGGDEFTLLAYNVDQKHAEEMAESFIVLMRNFVFYEAGETIKIYLSIGVTLIDDENLTSQEYLNEADAAVHQAKSQGRNGYRIFQRGSQGRVQESGIGWNARLKQAIDGRQAVLYYQPLIGLKAQQERIYEVLLRLPGLEQKLIGPDAFMAMAERFRLMAEFDRQVIVKAATVLADLNNPLVYLSLNLSEQFLEKNDISEFLDSVVCASKTEPGRIIFELPARFAAHNQEQLKPVLVALGKRGYRFAIDDFGADFGSLNYVRSLPVHFLKIDGTLIFNIATDNIVKAQVRAIVDVASELGIETIAKHVIDEESIRALRELGVDYAQGNHIGIPSPQLPGAAYDRTVQ